MVPGPMKRTKVIIRAAALAVLVPLGLASCSPESYRQDADREVGRILKERKNATVGYEP